jgi:hypothetical protein
MDATDYSGESEDDWLQFIWNLITTPPATLRLPTRSYLRPPPVSLSSSRNLPRINPGLSKSRQSGQRERLCLPSPSPSPSLLPPATPTSTYTSPPTPPRARPANTAPVSNSTPRRLAPSLGL